MSQISFDISRRLDIFARKDEDIDQTFLVKLDGADYDFGDATVTMLAFIGASAPDPSLTFEVTQSPGQIRIQMPASKIRKDSNYIYFLKVDGKLWLNGKFVINEGLWDGIDGEASEDITIKINSDVINIDLNISGGGVDTGYKGVFVSLMALESAYPTGQPGWSADVDEGPGFEAIRYIWDVQDGWVNNGPAPAVSLFPSDIVATLGPGKSFGKFTNGQTVPAAGKSAVEVITIALADYLAPVWSGQLAITGQAQTVEVGTTISGNKTFTWAVTNNSGQVNVLDIVDATAPSTLATNTNNDGTEILNVGSYQLNTNGAARSYRGDAKDANNGNAIIPSALFTILARFLRFFGPVAAVPADSTAVRALSSAFQTAGASFQLNTGTVQKIFVIALPPGFTLQSVIDLDALNADITSGFVASTITVQDAGSTNRTYNLYVMTNSIPFAANHRFQITTS